MVIYFYSIELRSIDRKLLCCNDPLFRRLTDMKGKLTVTVLALAFLVFGSVGIPSVNAQVPGNGACDPTLGTLTNENTTRDTGERRTLTDGTRQKRVYTTTVYYLNGQRCGEGDPHNYRWIEE